MAERTSRWGHTIIVDDEDADLLPDVCRIKRPNVYVNVTGKGTMGRVVLARKLGRELLRSERADHINLNKMDNRRSNLRLATQAQNCANVDKSRHTKNPYKGAYRFYTGRFNSFITVKQKKIQLGLFDTAIEAHRAWCIAALTHHGDFANFGANSPFLGWTLEMFEQPIVQLSLPIKEAA